MRIDVRGRHATQVRRPVGVCECTGVAHDDGRPPELTLRRWPTGGEPCRQPSPARTIETTRLKEKIAKLKEEMRRLHGLKTRMLATPDQQISLTDPDARSMATSGRRSGVVGYNVQVAVDTEHHLIITHEVTNVGTDRAQLAQVDEPNPAVDPSI
jgi:hypothetical protein